MAAPVVLTSEELSTREARTVVFVSSEEILPRKIPAYVKSPSEISWLFRQPSASAIMINKPFVELELEFTLTKKNAAGVAQAFAGGELDFKEGEAGDAGAKVYGRQMEGFPFLSKCVRTSVISINGATQTYRNSEMFTPYLRSQIGREAMKKLNVPWNSMCKQTQGYANGYSQRTNYKILSESDSEQASAFELAASMDGTLGANPAFVALVPAAAGSVKTKRMIFREPLFMGIFGGLQGNDAFPLWSCEQNKSPSILHAQNITINLNLLDNWAQNLYGLQQISATGANNYEVASVSIVSANLCCTYVQPPPKFIASALSSNVTYASTKFLRFEREAAGQTTQVHPVQAGGAPAEFVFQVVSFPYMPSCFMIEIQPDYNTKSKRLAKAGAGNILVDGATQIAFNTVEASKLDKRLSIVQLDLIINTSPDVVPSHGANVYNDANIINVRYNSRQLYELYLKNCASVERSIYSFEQWFRSGCTVLLTPADFNGILTPAHCRGNISVSGTIYAVNHMGYSVYVGSGAPGAINGGAGANWPHGTMEKYRAAIVAVYSNSYLALDAKSGLVGENVMSEQFAAGLRLTDI